MEKKEKAVLLSVHPKYCELIACRKKMLELRRTKPETGAPFKVYIYQTKTRWAFDLLREAGAVDLANVLSTASGKVIGEFVCDDVIDVWPGYAKGDDCLTYEEQEAYLGERGHGYGWHISDLRIYNEPLRIEQFTAVCQRAYCYEACPHLASGACWAAYGGGFRVLKRPPQSWCYVAARP